MFDDAAGTYRDVLRSNNDDAAAHRGCARAVLGLDGPRQQSSQLQAVLASNPGGRARP